jgi:hypothetical protein
MPGGGYGVAKRSDPSEPQSEAQDQISVAEVERIISAIPGVDRAKVVVNDWGAIESIHVLGDTSRPAKHVVRDIESALAAQVGILVDRRKISLAQVRAPDRPPPAPRLALGAYGIDADALTRRTLVRVTLVSPDEPQVRFEGAAEAGAGEGDTEEAMVRAALRAMEQALPTDVHVLVAGSRRLVERDATVWVTMVRVVREGLGETLHAGAAVETSSPSEAVVRSTLAAMADVIGRTGLRLPGGAGGAEGPGLEDEDFA